MDVTKVVNKSLLQGDNEFETGILTIPAATTVPAGAFLKREASGKFAVVTDTEGDPGEEIEGEKPVALNPVEAKNPAAAAVDYPFRACISGKVRFDMCTVGGQPITDAQGDLLRQYAGIITKKVTDLSWTD